MDDLTELVKAAQRGDAEFYGQLVLRHQDMAYACAVAYLGDAHLAHDAAQEAFVAAFIDLKAGKLNDPAALSGWLKTIVRRQCSRLIRNKQLETESINSAAHVAAPASSDETDRLTQRRSAMAALQALPESYRLVTILYYFNGYSTEQAAEFLGLPLTTVKKRLHDARRKLQEWVVNAMNQNLQEHSPSRDPKFAEKIQRLIRPEALKKNEALVWSPGLGTEVWELFCAAISGDLQTITRMVGENPKLARCQYEYRTPLHFAVRENQLEVAAFLIENGADPTDVANGKIDMARERGYAQMQKLLETKLDGDFRVSAKGIGIAAAIRERNLEKVKSLLDAEPDLLHAGDERTNQPIHWAVMTRQIEIIDELLKRGADINARRADGARPIQLLNGDYHHRGGRDNPKDATSPQAVYKHLLSRGAGLDISTASHMGELARVRELLDQDPTLANRPSEYVTYYPCSGSPLRNAAGAGHIEIVKLLLERGADPNLPEDGIAPRGAALYEAAAAGHHEIARLLLERGAYPNSPVESSGDCLSRAIGNKDQKMVDLLASYGGAMSMEILAYYGDVRTAAAIFAVDPSLADDPDAFAYAAEEGHESFVRLMLLHQPNLTKRVGWHRWRRCAKTLELNELLFKHGLDPSQPDWLRLTPLHRFAEKGDVDKAALFIDHGADLNAREDELCATPLGIAARCGQKAMVELLLRRGARTNLPDDPPWATPLAFAERKGHREIAEILRTAGAK